MNKLVKAIRTSTATKELTGMMLITILTQLFAVYKSSITAANFGACVELDAYNFSNNLTSFFLTFVSSGITTVVIPAYVKRLDRKAVDTFLSVVFSVTGTLLCATFLFRGELVDLLASSREPIFKDYVCSTMLLTIGIQTLPAVLGVTTAYYQCIGKFNVPKLILLISNISIVIVLSVLNNFTLHQYLYVLLAGAVVQFVLDLLFAIKSGFKFSITFDVKNIHYKELMMIFLPTLFSTGVYKINTFIDTILSSNIGTGQLTVLSYSNMIVAMVNMLIVGNLTTYVYPKIVKNLDFGDRISQKYFWSYANIFHAVICLIIVGFIAVGREFIGLLYEHGEFSKQAANSVYLCMCIYIFAQQNNTIRDLLYRYFFAVGDTKTTVSNGVMTSCINIVASILLVKKLGIYGIITGTFFAGCISLLGIVVRFKRSFGFKVNMKPIIRIFLGTEVTMLITVAAIFAIKSIITIESYFVSFLTYGIITIILYIGVLIILNRKMINTLSD